MRIAVDLLGGDNAPDVVVDGALRACAADPAVHLLLVGPPAVAEAAVAAAPAATRDRLSVLPATRAVAMTDPATRGGRPETTVRAAVAAVAAGTADAVVSAGASGAIVTAAALGFGRLPGIRRPALAASLPAVAGPVVLLDVGGSLDCGPATLLWHAALGAAYAALVHDRDRPRVGLLSIGVEPGKGDRARRLADPALAAADLPRRARYVGLVEGHEVCDGSRADVVVTDGFTGNILLKGIEGAYAMAGAASTAPRAGALLGVRGTAVVCHGAAGPADVASGIALAATLYRRRVAQTLAAIVADRVEA
ncbi:phosphate acyltransferase [Pilimelia terevasa]|uniref:Phosphate acyltransferase n=1 Tax=Pilimelia terevasa TaxID=53372 RepID=A0A8J3BP58_9ACTN|nr:phosphate acyltransferase PlsX [Pilimelia terevasa]GGK28295.1 phosphate acyltransferase [Pilimelia terevasa]